MTASAQSYEIEEVKLVATVQTINGINEKSSDFAPIIFNNKIYFTSSRPYNLHNLGENNWDKNGFTNLFYGSFYLKEAGVISVNDVKLVSNKLISNSNTGPMCLTSTGDSLFFTRKIEITKGKEKFLRSQLFLATKKDGKFTKIKRLPFSVDDYSYAHPAFDAATNRLYFVSDQPGGLGKSDLYYVDISKGAWGEPMNLIELNSESNENYPFVVRGNIFFSSDRDGSEGQLDIYFLSAEKEAELVKIEGLNSSADDFGIAVLPNMSAGYFSSTREGDANIYYFTLEKRITVKNQIAGSFTFKSLNPSTANLTVNLVNNEGEFVYVQKADVDGRFVFENVMLDTNLRVKINGLNENDAQLNFYDEFGNISSSYVLGEDGKFLYKKLNPSRASVIHFIPDDMINYERSLAHLSGKLVLESKPFENLSEHTVNLVDQDKNILLTTKTDQTGNFEFKELATSTDYFIQIPDCGDEFLLYIYGSKDNIYSELKCNSQDDFMFRKLNTKNQNSLSLLHVETESDFMLNYAEIIGNFNTSSSDKNCLNSIVRAYDQNGLLVGTTTTDSLGNFEFGDLRNDTQHQFRIECDASTKLSLFNRYGDQIALIEASESNYFIYRPLGFQTNNELSALNTSADFDINLSNEYETVLVYFGSNQANVLPEDLEKLELIYKLLKKYPQLQLSVSAYADAQASDDYNFLLSQKRGQWIANYLIEKGIEKNRFSVNAYGESKLVDATNDASNRRAELRFYLKH
ncbi:MAG: OmpA family protein [Crocinitomix sp.]|nr:OmpA family protein [Crocinitomix sp.]